MAAQTIEVHPNVSKNVVIAAIGCTAFTVGGFWMLLSGEEMLAGLLCVVFFGGGGIYGVPKMLRRRVTMVLTPEGIEQRYVEGNAYIQWADVEGVGIVSVAASKMVGIRLKTYDHYLDGMSPSLAEFMTKSLPYMKLLTRATALLDVPAAVTVWTRLKGRVDLEETLGSFGKVGSLAQALLWTREQFGYDLVFSWVEIDRPAAKFVALLEGYLPKEKQG